MMGYIHTAASFRQTFGYCLEDKKLSPAERIIPQSPAQRATPGEVRFRDRAEVLYYNQCFGARDELIRQFNMTRHLRPNMSEAVFHISLSFPPGERLPKSTLVDISLDCARSFDFDRHQFVTILHKDTKQQHIHIVANRIGFDRHVAIDSFSKGHMADYCRQAELRYDLTREPGPRRYLSPEQRLTPCQGIRLTRLKESISHALQAAIDFPSFEKSMTLDGYKVFKSERGIAFRDLEHVTFKGSEAGYPWKEISRRLSQQLEQKQQLEQEQKLEQHQTQKLSYHLHL